jgi:CBS domain containing-hemolysin-like protein
LDGGTSIVFLAPVIVEANSNPWVDVLLLLTVPLLVGLNGLFVAAEFALVAVRKTRVEQLVSHGVKGARAVEGAVANLDRSIAATQLGITLASIALGFVGEPALEHRIRPLFQALGPSWEGVASRTVSWTIAFFLITFMHVVFGELIPKTMALQSPDRTALWVARPLNAFAWITRPLILLMNGTGNLILRLSGFRPASEGLVHSVEELLLLIEDTEEAGVLDPEQAEFVQNVFRLSGKRVRDCMVPRERMAALELTTPPDKVLESVRTGAHTRMPVYEGALDNVVGIVNTKDLFYLFSLRGVVVLEDAMYPPLYLKPDETVANALRLFRKAHRPMALVRDDEGKVHGLITLEDVLEEIVGDIEDEHDRPTPKVKLVPRLKRVLSRPPAPPK